MWQKMSKKKRVYTIKHLLSEGKEKYNGYRKKYMVQICLWVKSGDTWGTQSSSDKIQSYSDKNWVGCPVTELIRKFW